MRGTLSMIGLYNYDNTLFDDMVIPVDLNRDIFTYTTLQICGELEVVYPDFDFCKKLLGWFSKHRAYTWNELYKTLNYEYDPIANYDRKEDYTDTETTSGTGKSKGSDTTTGKDTTTGINSVTSFNTYDFKPAGKAETDGKNESSSTSDSNIETSTERTLKHVANLRGNIGVTTTQEMINAQRKVVEFDIYKYIAEDIKKNFCILVY